MQDACNLVAVLGAMHDGAKYLMSQGLDTDAIRLHPAMVLFADKVNQLCGRPGMTEFSSAFARAEERNVDQPKHVHLNDTDGKWWFWDETQSDRYGPYPNITTAYAAMDRYVREVRNSPKEVL